MSTLSIHNAASQSMSQFTIFIHSSIKLEGSDSMDPPSPDVHLLTMHYFGYHSTNLLHNRPDVTRSIAPDRDADSAQCERRRKSYYLHHYTPRLNQVFVPRLQRPEM